LVGGHQRVKAAKLAGITTVPVAFVDLSEAEEKALNVALNSHTIQGKYDTEILSTLVDDIKAATPDLAMELNFEQLEKDLKIDFEEDTSPGLEKPEPKTKILECPHCKQQFEASQAKTVGA
jgi:hypothetical protein